MYTEQDYRDYLNTKTKDQVIDVLICMTMVGGRNMSNRKCNIVIKDLNDNVDRIRKEKAGYIVDKV